MLPKIFKLKCGYTKFTYYNCTAMFCNAGTTTISGNIKQDFPESVMLNKGYTKFKYCDGILLIAK